MDTRIESLVLSLLVLCSQVNPENCIGYRLTPALVDKDLASCEAHLE